MPINMEDEPRALQVVTVDNGSFCFDEELLSSALLGEAADRPVALCSVAGAFRGGKSFLLDYLLRYLQADARADEAWLGEEEEPLRGFSWRGGSGRDTTGLLLWSEPTVMQLPSGEEVAVILMDTQGAFDWRSSVRDCSTVFALSALLASVQIYNVSRDIRADELQHLQLFTEYGRLAAQGEQAAFNSLQLVVRDWSCPYDHPYGSDGGTQLLQARFQEMQNTELVTLWQSIEECFQQVNCFLMPHPGLRALNRDFDGRHADLTPEFKEALMELAPTILSPMQLTPKSVNGQVLTGRALYQYFKSYLEIFNSGQMPSPATILKATAEAGLLANCEETRRLYRRLMEEDEVSVAREKLRMRHESARENSLRAFLERRTLAAPAAIEEHVQKLRAELDEQLEIYDLINESKIRKGIAEAETAYKEYIQNEIGDLQRICVHPNDFERLHEEAKDAAVRKFNSTRIISEDCEDKDLDTLVKSITETARWLRENNEANNDSAVREAISAYVQHMMETCAPHAPALHPRQLRKEDEDAQQAAIREFQNRRSIATNHQPDTYRMKIKDELERRLPEWTESNEWKNERTIETAVGVYNKSMETYCETSLLSPFHTIDVAVNFEKKHVEFRAAAVRTFYDWSRGSRSIYDKNDVFLNLLKMKLEQRKQMFWNSLQSDTVVAGVTTVVGAAAAAVGLGVGFMMRFMR